MQCQTTDTLGFPIKIQPNLNNLESADLSLLKGITETHNFSVSWPSPASPISYGNPSNNQLDVTAFNKDTFTLTYGNVLYKVHDVLSIVNNQHTKFTDGQLECILAFKLSREQHTMYPSLPDIILLCRPIIFSDNNYLDFLNCVTTKRSLGLNNGISTLFTYEGNSNILLPMITYQTCIPIQYKSSSSDSFKIGSLKLRVNVIRSPVYAPSRLENLVKTTGRTVYSFPGLSYYDTIQLTNRLPIATDPVGTSNILTTIQATSPIASDVSTLITKIIILAPDALLGQPFSALSISSASKLKDATRIDLSADRTSSSSRNKRYQCYRFDPSQDIDSNNQILIDPTNGQRLENVMSNLRSSAAGGNPDLLNGYSPDAGIKPGDVQAITLIVLAILGTVFLILYLLYIFYLIRSPPEEGLYGKIAMHIFGFLTALGALTMICIYLDASSPTAGKIDASAKDTAERVRQSNQRIADDVRNRYDRDAEAMRNRYNEGKNKESEKTKSFFSLFS
jgi:hypothetical protein